MRLVTLLLIVLVISLPFTLAVNLNYDDNGNLINGDGKFRQYNGFNELVVVRNGNAPSGPVLENYTWHPTEDRLFLKVVYEGAVVKERIFYMSENFVRVQNDSGNFDFTYVYQNGQLVAQENPDGSKYFVHTDHLGSVSLVTDENGNIVEETFYSPFGEIISGGDELRYDYEGKEFDSNTGVYDFHARKYKPTVPKIFESPDPIIQNIYDPQTLNHYAFERNNPVNRVDEDGRNSILIGAAIGFGTEVAIQTIFAGDIYNIQAIGESTIAGAVIATFLVPILAELEGISVLGIEAGNIVELSIIYSEYLDIIKKVEEAKENKGKHVGDLDNEDLLENLENIKNEKLVSEEEILSLITPEGKSKRKESANNDEGFDIYQNEIEKEAEKFGPAF